MNKCLIYLKTLSLKAPPNDQKFSKLRRGLDKGYNFFITFLNFFLENRFFRIMVKIK